MRTRSRCPRGTLGGPRLGGPPSFENESVTYTLKQGDAYDHALSFGGGLLLSIPGSFGGELFANATDATFAPYGLFGAHQGLGALVQLRWTTSQELFGQNLYLGGDLSGVLRHPHPSIDVEPDAGVLGTFTDTVRFGFSVGLAFSRPGYTRLPALDMECVRRNRSTPPCRL